MVERKEDGGVRSVQRRGAADVVMYECCLWGVTVLHTPVMQEFVMNASTVR